MQPQIRLARILGIDIGLHYSWLIIAVLITLSLGAHFHETNPEWSERVIWTTAIITGLLFFTAIVLHELAHAMVARARGLTVRSITLFALGGVAQIEKEAADAKTEFWMGIAGPIMSVVIGFICLGLANTAGWRPPMPPETPAVAILVWLGYINFMLAAFNMIPGFPLDGGRVLRAVIWWVTGNPDRSTRIAAIVGQTVAGGFILLGLLRFFIGGADFGGLWLAFIGWFLLDAARAAYFEAELTARMRGVRVRDVMVNECAAVDPHSNLQGFAEDYLRSGRRCFVVKSNGRVMGLITPHDLKEIERSRWASTTVEQAMRPLPKLRTVTPDTPLLDALHVMSRDDVNQLPVISNGRLEGVLSRGDIFLFLDERAQLQM